MKKRFIQTISMMILGVMLSCVLCFNTAKADESAYGGIDIDKLIADCLVDAYGDGNGIVTGTLQDGVSIQRQGWLVYIIDQYGSILYEPAFLYRTTGNFTYDANGATVQLNSRIGNHAPTQKIANNDLPLSYYNIGGENASEGISNIDNVKSYLLASTGTVGEVKLHQLIKNVWNESAKEAFKDQDNRYYFVMEPVYWHGTHEKIPGSSTSVDKTLILMKMMLAVRNLPSNIKNAILADAESKIPSTRETVTGYRTTGFYCGTVYNGAIYEDANPGCFCGILVYRHKIYPRSIKVMDNNYVFLNKATKDGDQNISTAEQKAQGYGIGLFSNHLDEWGDNPGEALPPPVNIDTSNSASLYETKNFSNVFDISKAIPSSEQVTNAINCASMVNNDGFCATNTVNSGNTWTISVPYTWTENIIYTYEETRTLYKTVTDQESADVYTSLGYEVTKISNSGNERVLVASNVSSRDMRYYSTGGYVSEYKGFDKFDVYKIVPTQWFTWDVYKITPGGSWTDTVVHTIGTKTYKFEAQVSYLYVNSVPGVFAFNNAKIYNAAFENLFLSYDRTNSSIPAVSAMLKLYNATGNPTIVSTTQGDTLNGISLTPGAGHVNWGTPSLTGNGVTINVNTIEHYAGSATGYSHEQMMSDVASKESSIISPNVAAIQSAVKSRNDYFEVSDSNISHAVLLNDDWITGCSVTVYANGSPYNTYSGDSAATQRPYGYSGYTLTGINDRLLAARVTGHQTTTIPANCDNGDYTTGMIVEYKNIFDGTSKKLAAGSTSLGATNDGVTVDSIYKHVMADGVGAGHSGHIGGPEADGYPIRVHTPVESPIDIVYYNGTTAFENTQLIGGSSLNSGVDHQLLLDKSYFVQWKSDEWTSNVYGDVGYGTVFDRYVSDKYLRFPFDVVYNNKLYYASHNGYTEWIKIQKPLNITDAWNNGAVIENYESNNHWQMTPFYIPSFAGETGSIGEDVWVECKVEAINTVGRFEGDHSQNVFIEGTGNVGVGNDDAAGNAGGNTTNADAQNYVAVCNRKIQLSGWMYDFSIVGNTNLAVYTGEGLGLNGTDKDLQLSTNIWPMAADKSELKIGNANRFGTNNIRYLKDGTITTSMDNRLLLPLRNGLSTQFSKMGDLWRAQRFAFTLKTMGDMSNLYDSVDIVPTYVYVKDDGTVLDGSQFWMVQRKGELQSGFYTYNPSDTTISNNWYTNSYTLGDKMFKDSYYDSADVSTLHYGDWVNRSVAYEIDPAHNNAAIRARLGRMSDVQTFLNREIPSFTLSHIKIPASARYLGGEFEQLERNDGIDNPSILKTYASYLDFNNAKEIEFKNSIQQWNGEFGMPQYLKIVDRTGNPYTTIQDYLRHLSNNGGYNWDDESVFGDLKGRLIINFDIVVNRTYCNTCGHFCKNDCPCVQSHSVTSKPYLKYNAGNANDGGLNMWQQEGFNNTIDSTLLATVTLRDGDVAIVDTSRSLADYYTIGYFMIN